MDAFEFICQDMGMPVNDEKSEGPMTKLMYFGIELDSEGGEFRISLEKNLLRSSS